MATIVLQIQTNKKSTKVTEAHILRGRNGDTVREHGRTLRAAEIKALIKELAK